MIGIVTLSILQIMLALGSILRINQKAPARVLIDMSGALALAILATETGQLGPLNNGAIESDFFAHEAFISGGLWLFIGVPWAILMCYARFRDSIIRSGRFEKVPKLGEKR